MKSTIHVELECPNDADDLIEFLAAEGLSASITALDDHCELEVGYAIDPEERLTRDFEEALATWLERRGRPLVPVAGHNHDYVLRPPAG